MIPVTNQDFARELYRFAPSDYHAGIACSFPGDPHDDRRGKWAPRAVRNGQPWPHEVHDDWNNYVCVSTFFRSPTGYRRLKSQFSRLCAVMIDDVGTKVDAAKIRLEPSARVETSPGNFQDWLFLTPSAGSDDLETATRLVDRLVASGLTKDGTDPGMKGVTRVGRLPVGVNSKPAYGSPPPAVRLVLWQPERRYTVEEVAAAYGLDMTPPPPKPEREHSESTVEASAGEFERVVAALEAEGALIGESADGYDVVCPWVDSHTARAQSGTKLFTPSAENAYLGGFKCHHGHCTERTIGDVLDWATRRGAADFEPPSEDAIADAKVVADQKRARLTPLEIDELLELERPGWIVKGVLPRAALAVIYGEPGSGKSFLATDLGLAIAAGRAWRGHRVRRGRVVYIAAEGAGGFRNRMEASKVAGLAARGFQVIPAAPNFLSVEDARELAGAIGRADVLVVDTFAQVTPGANENTSEDVGRALACCRALHAATGALVVLVHHAGKDASKGARGWSGLKAAADAEIEVSRAGDTRVAKVTKQKDGGDGAAYPFRLSTVHLGVDEDGDEISSCVVEHLDGVPSEGRRPKGPNQVLLWEIVHELAGVSGEALLEDVVEAAIPRIVQTDGKRDRRRYRAERALEELAAAGFVRLDGDLVRV